MPVDELHRLLAPIADLDTVWGMGGGGVGQAIHSEPCLCMAALRTAVQQAPPAGASCVHQACVHKAQNSLTCICRNKITHVYLKKYWPIAGIDWLGTYSLHKGEGNGHGDVLGHAVARVLRGRCMEERAKQYGTPRGCAYTHRTHLVTCTRIPCVVVSLLVESCSNSVRSGGGGFSDSSSASTSSLRRAASCACNDVRAMKMRMGAVERQARACGAGRGE